MDGTVKWQVKMSNEASRDLDRLSKGVLTEDDRIVIRAWAERILTSGPEAVRAVRITATHDYSKGKK
jgi:hypothetical protein